PSIEWTLSPYSYVLSVAGAFGPGPYEKIVEDEGATSVSASFGHTRGFTSATALSSHTVITAAVNDDQYAESRGEYARSFTLTPNTGLAISALGTIHAQVGGIASLAAVEITGTLADSVDGTAGVMSFSNSHETQMGVDTEGSFRLQGYLYSGDQARSGSINLLTRALSFAPISSVPEPGSWAMMLAGAALIGACVHRRAASNRRTQPTPAFP
ncbi:MAG: PEP-CTERM sorting domain-containing protein, partial [Gammaproteobacteria bacterium]